jgi:hypothetical protein
LGKSKGSSRLQCTLKKAGSHGFTRDEARRIAADIAKLPELLRKVELLGLLQAATADSEKNFPNIQYGFRVAGTRKSEQAANASCKYDAQGEPD